MVQIVFGKIIGFLLYILWPMSAWNVSIVHLTQQNSIHVYILSKSVIYCTSNGNRNMHKVILSTHVYSF